MSADHQIGPAESFTLISGENIVRTGTVKVKGMEFGYGMTNWALRLVGGDNSTLVLPYKCIQSVKKRGGKRRLGFYGIRIDFSTGVFIELQMSRRENSRPEFYRSINALMEAPYEMEKSIYDSDFEWMRDLESNTEFRLIGNSFCSTYPPRLFIPVSFNESLVESCAMYRTKERLLFVSFVLRGNGSPLIRSSQPKTGILNRTSESDKMLLESICNGRSIKIIDCRPKVNAVLNSITGGGYELEDSYQNASFAFLNIPNIHKVRSAYVSMINDDNNIAWGELIVQLVKSGKLVSDLLCSNTAVLVHCTDGWDRTAQISSIASIITDYKSRSITGFKSVIEREWCDIGHKFELRNCPSDDESQNSPVFVQFLDAVYQIMKANQSAFEFNEKLLVYLGFHSYSQLYGDFVGNCYRERVSIERAPSLWSSLESSTMRNNSYSVVEGALQNIPTEYVRFEEMYRGPIPGCSMV